MVEKRNTSFFILISCDGVDDLFVIKVLRKDILRKRNKKLHFKSEKQFMENLDSPFIVQLRHAFQTNEKVYLIMDFMNGGTNLLIRNNFSRRIILSLKKRRSVH